MERAKTRALSGRRGNGAAAAHQAELRAKDVPVFDEEGRSVAWITRTIHRLYNAQAQSILDREGVTIAHWYYLRVLARHGSLNQLELSRRVGIASTTAVTALDSMEQRGLLRRTRDPNDRRKYFVTLTEEGHRILRALMPDIERMMTASLRGIPEGEIRTFWKVAQRLVANLHESAATEQVLD